MQAKKSIEAIKVLGSNVLQEDESSRLCTGKKDTVTLKKCKLQKILLNDPLENLHKKFLHHYPQCKIRFSVSCKLRPFWVLIPKARDRDTCLCITNENMELIVAALKQKEINKENTQDEVYKALSCEGAYFRENCLIKSCNDCQ
ncbi:hypothetical protein AVEN_202891-1 [Araneus ventricosus]|uniref:Uncharacterized protein n=1 Tax=Araneus ventricosus TaxID=182803 RepID=A0A4Y2FLP7_ARAVE|nr:hypothetical protein AVEN_202891-1 [Araneus ventricosus]